MKIIISIGMLIFTVVVAILAAKKSDRLALAISLTGLLVLALLTMMIVQ